MPQSYKQAILQSDGHNTLLTEIADIAFGLVWPGAMSRVARNRFIERWAGREWALRQSRVAALQRLQAARKSGDVEEGPLSMGQDAGLIHDIVPAAEIVARIAREADDILSRKLAGLVAPIVIMLAMAVWDGTGVASRCSSSQPFKEANPMPKTKIAMPMMQVST